jgi:hypothetical protein
VGQNDGQGNNQFIVRKIKYTYIVNDFESRDPDNDLFYFPIEIRFKYFGDNV